MKRKGLIVSSIIMVIVLIASLTTATYAWFSASSNAKIQDLVLSTVTSTGLSIGTPNTYATADLPENYKSGVMVANADIYKGFNGQDTGFGTYLQMNATDFTSGFYAASGDGLDMWSAYNSATAATDDKPELVSGAPQFVGRASNKSYFFMDFVVLNTDDLDAEKDLVLDEITFVANAATGQSVVTEAIAASARLALLGNVEYTPKTVPDDPDTPGIEDGSFSVPDHTKPIGNAVPLAEVKTALENRTNKPKAYGWTIENNGIFCIEPFANVYKTTTGKWQTKAVDENKFVHGTYPTTPTTAIAYDTTLAAYTKKISTSYTGDRHIKLNATASPDVDWAQELTTKGMDAKGSTFSYKFSQLMADTNGIHCGTFNATDNAMLFRLALWFEGLDAECVQELAKGGGIKVNLSFTTAAPFAGGPNA